LNISNNVKGKQLSSGKRRFYDTIWKKVLTDAVASGEIGPKQDLDTVAATLT